MPLVGHRRLITPPSPAMVPAQARQGCLQMAEVPPGDGVGAPVGERVIQAKVPRRQTSEVSQRWIGLSPEAANLAEEDAGGCFAYSPELAQTHDEISAISSAVVQPVQVSGVLIAEFRGSPLQLARGNSVVPRVAARRHHVDHLTEVRISQSFRREQAPLF